MREDEFQQLRTDVAYLMDRIAILDCIASHARGHDRHDVDLITNAYYDDGVDEHGRAINLGSQYAAWINRVHAAGSQAHTHNITTHNCEIDGHTAHCESYVLVCLLNHDGVTARLISGRYIDRLEKRDGQWRIVVRRSTVELMFTADASILQTDLFKEQGYPRGTRNRDDPSYQRPLNLVRGASDSDSTEA
jgi:ketosteroid isomerase-like protein